MSRPGSWRPHVLVVTVDRCSACPPDGLCADCQEEPELQYTVECPGPSGNCDAWDECPTCYVPGQGLSADRREELEQESHAHGVEHLWVDGRYMVRLSPPQCYVAGHDALPDAAQYVATAPGRYPVEHDVGDGTELELHLVPPCPQAWHMGLSTGLLRECRYLTGHRGKHRTADGRLEWYGKLTEEELALAAQLREAAAA